MKNKVSILVTGCGGDIGQSIGKILNEYSQIESLYGIDISDKNAGQFIFKNFSLGLPCRNEGYISSLKKFIIENSIDIIIPIAEPELRFMSKNNIMDHIGDATLIAASQYAQEIGFDKLKTATFLRENKLPYPETNLISEINSIDRFPVIIKSRTGYGSTQVHVINNQDSFEYLKKQNEDYIVQEYLESEQGEYTCGVYRSAKKELRTIILKRELTGGYSGYGEVVENEQITILLEAIANKLNLTGSINVQLRLTDKEPVVFEINPRFSSTVFFRHMFGFEDLIWSIEDALELEISPYDNDFVGKQFFKGFSEYIK